MRYAFVILAAWLALAVVAQAQVVDMSASTAAEGYQRGFADVIRARGQANLANSAAAINLTEAERNAIENDKIWTDTYFEMRAANRAYRKAESGPRISNETWVRYAQQGAPARLSPNELDTITGRIHWPPYLRTDEFAAGRDKIEPIYAERADSGAIGYDDYMIVKQTTDTMLELLKKKIAQIPPNIYTASKRFLQSLAYEAQKPPS